MTTTNLLLIYFILIIVFTVCVLEYSLPRVVVLDLQAALDSGGLRIDHVGGRK